MKDFQEAGFREEVMPGILKGNAVRLLGLDTPAAVPAA
jgi:predicted TIM-barrel fold metal-dependent hydrolase